MPTVNILCVSIIRG